MTSPGGLAASPGGSDIYLWGLRWTEVLLGGMRVNPRALKIVAGLFILSGGWAIVGFVLRLCFSQPVIVDLTVFDLLIGRWLLNREPRGHFWALVSISFEILGVVIMLVLIAFADAKPEFKIAGNVIGHPHPALAFIGISVLSSVTFWQYHVLMRPDIRVLFANPKPMATEPVAPAG